MPGDDQLEGEVLDFRSPPVTHNARRPWVILFASVLNASRAEQRARAEEWRQLFGGTGHA